MNFYLIRNRKAPWGDYGNVLLYGFVSRENDEIIIERVGPFTPVIYMYNKYIVVSDGVKNKLECCKLNGVEFVSSKKKKIVNVNWQDWDPEGRILEKPKSGEPEDFILKGKHDEILAKKIPELWVISPINTAKGLIDNSKKVQGEYYHISLDVSTWNSCDVFRTPELGHVFCTQHFKDAVEGIGNSYLTFIPVFSLPA